MVRNGLAAGRWLPIGLTLAAAPAAAVQFDFTATVESIQGDTAFAAVSVGATLDGCYEFDESAPDQQPDLDSLGVYEAIRAMVVRGIPGAGPPSCGPGDAACAVCTGIVNDAISVVDLESIDQYSVLLDCFATLIESGTGPREAVLGFQLQADDIDDDALPDDGLPAVPPDVADFSDGPPEQRLIQVILTPTDPLDDPTGILARLDTLSLAEPGAVPCPEPGAGTLASAAAAGLGLTARRRARSR